MWKWVWCGCGDGGGGEGWGERDSGGRGVTCGGGCSGCGVGVWGRDWLAGMRLWWGRHSVQKWVSVWGWGWGGGGLE